MPSLDTPAVSMGVMLSTMEVPSSTALLPVSFNLHSSLLQWSSYSFATLDQAGDAGLTKSGIAVAGNGAGGGGIALSGNTGTAYGGSVQNTGGLIVNGFKASE